MRTYDLSSILRALRACIPAAVILTTGPALYAGTALQLARALYHEQQWAACRIESRRVPPGAPGGQEARLLRALAETRLGMDTLAQLTALGADADMPEELRLQARYEEAVLRWRNGEHTAARRAWREVFMHTADRDLFLRAGCMLGIVRHADEDLPDDDGLLPQLLTASIAWTPELRAACRAELRPAEKRPGFNPGRSFIAFYRTQIRPAIGDRCVLVPSCSEYSRQAFAKHGFLLGIPMTADRFIREPDVTKNAEQPVLIGESIFYGDPLSDHDWWLKSDD